jgi:hypothetical protein
MIDTLLIAGVSIATGWIWSRVVLRKPKPIVRSSSSQEDAEALKEVDRILGIDSSPPCKTMPIIKWCGDMYNKTKGWQCPKCWQGWHNEMGLRCCDCDTLAYSHYHLICNGLSKDGKSGVGCDTKFLMLAGDVPSQIDPNKLIAIELPEKKKDKETKDV